MKNLFTKMILLFFVSMLTVGALGATPDKDYLCITAEEAGAKVQLTKTGTPAAVNLEYTTDGSAWKDFVIGTTTVTLANVGDKVYLRNKEEAKDVTTFSESVSAYYRFTFSDSVSVSGNIMSLVDKNVETTTIPCDYCFCSLFNSSIKLTSVADLKLPATMLTTGCYQQMYQNCKALKTAGALPATTLAASCYQNMFTGCSALETAPALPADTLAEKCYYQMFNGCKKLNYVEVGFTAWYPTNATANWLGNVAAEGTFVCPDGLDVTTRGVSYVPSGWTVTHPAKPDYLCFTAGEAGAKVQLTKTGTPVAVNLEYTTDGSAWKDFVIGTTTVTLAHVGDKVYLRNKKEAKDVTTFSESTSNYYRFTFSDSVSVSGNIMSLVDKNVETTTIPCDYCFCRLFNGSIKLTSVADLKLPATMLTTGCYYSMFYGCTALETAPALPADTLAEKCYYSMFSSCKSLKTAGVLPATTLAESCYYQMFSGCTALETAPALPATTLAKQCYNNMFNGCIKLTTAPELSADTLAESCYYQMFNGCSALETAPALPATTLAKQCYNQMFYGCKKLKSVKVGFTKWGDLSDSGATDYRATYNWLKNAGTEATTPTFECPAELDMTTRDESHVPEDWTIKKIEPMRDYLCFTAEEAGAKVQLKENGTSDAVSLEYTTDGSAWTDFVIGTTEGCGVTLANVGDKVYLRNKKEAKDVATFSESNSKYYCFTFSDSVSVSGNVMSLVDKNVETTTIPCDYCFCRLFYNSTSLTSVADLKLPATMLTTGCYQRMFNGCKSLKTAGVLPATTLAEKCCYQMFYGCTALETAPALPADTLAKQCYDNMFNGCIKLTTAPELPADTLAERCYYGMFNDCAALETAPALPATTLAASCYDRMFSDCTALKTAPALPADTLAESCYYQMFSGCSALETAPALSATTLAEGCYQSMFSGCTALETAPALPAETLAESCYQSMFKGCSALETAPELPATTLAKQCYNSMFQDCTKLKSVKVGFTKWGDLSDSGATDYRATYNWLKDAGTEATTPTFECPAELDMTIRDEHHVPANWNMPTGIEEIKSQSTVNGQQSTDLYNLQGQKVSVNGFRGIVIKNGKRYLKR